MKKRFAVIVLSLCMVLALIPTAAFAADGDTIHVGGVALTGSEAEPAYALTDDSGSVTTEGAGESSYNIRWDGSTLTLNNATITQGYSQGYYKGAVTAISCGTDLKIELVGSNTVQGPDLTDEGAAETSGIYSEGSITISGTGTLDVRGGDITKTTGEGSAQSYGLYSGEEGNITISSGTVNAFGGDIDTVNGSASSSGISADGATVITGGKVTAAGDEITNNSGHAASIGIESYGGISIAGGSVEATGSSANVMGVNGNYAYSKGMYAYSGGISITGGSVEATGGSAEIISQDENATLYAESDGIDADNMNDSGGMSITGGSTVTATGGAAAVDGGDGIAYSYGISTGERITVEGSTVTATGGETTAGDWGAYSTGIEAYNDLVITGSKVEAAGSAGVGSVRADGIYAKDNITITDSQVTADGVSDYEKAPAYGGGIFSDAGNITISGEDTVIKAYSGYGQNGIAGISAEGGNITITDKADVTALAAVFNEYDEADYGPAFTTSDGGSVGDGIRAAGDITIDDATVLALGCEANYSSGIFSETGDITIESGSVNAYGGRAVNHTEPDAAGSAGISAEAGNVTINGGEVVAEVGLSEHGIADGIRAYADISIGGGKVTAVGALSSVDGVEPEYSGGIFSETGDITITGKDTVVEAGGGYAEKGSTAIGAEAGNLIIKDGKVRADGAYPVTSDTGFANGFSSVKADDGTGGNIIISGGDFEAIGYTDSVYCEGDLMASPDGTQITVKVLGKLIFDSDSWELDWDKMYDEAGEIEGSPFTSETIVAADSTAGMQYFGGSSIAYDPAGDGTDDPAGSEDPGDASGQDSSNAKTGDDMNLIFWTILMLAGGCAATGIVACNRRKR